MYWSWISIWRMLKKLFELKNILKNLHFNLCIIYDISSKKMHIVALLKLWLLNPQDFVELKMLIDII